MLYYTEYLSPVGVLTIVSPGDGIAGLWIEGQKYYFSTVSERPVRNDDPAVFGSVYKWLSRYFAGEKPSPKELKLVPGGSPFRQAVWRELCEIPYGAVTTYGTIARNLQAAKKSGSENGKGAGFAQAVGGAVAHNPISIIIPCHRVIGANGSLTGYAGGIDKKRWLLEMEGVDKKILTK